MSKTTGSLSPLRRNLNRSLGIARLRWSTVRCAIIGIEDPLVHQSRAPGIFAGMDRSPPRGASKITEMEPTWLQLIQDYPWTTNGRVNQSSTLGPAGYAYISTHTRSAPRSQPKKVHTRVIVSMRTHQSLSSVSPLCTEGLRAQQN